MCPGQGLHPLSEWLLPDPTGHWSQHPRRGWGAVLPNAPTSEPDPCSQRFGCFSASVSCSDQALVAPVWPLAAPELCVAGFRC